MRPRTYITVVAVTLGLMASGWLGIVLLTVGTPTVSSGPLCAMLAEKRRIAASIDPPGPAGRLFLVAGSSTHFGISAADIEAALGLPTVNFGTQAGITLEVALDDVRRVLQAGDIVLLAPEYERYRSSQISDVTVDYLFACGASLLRQLPLIQQVKAAFALSAVRAAAGIAARLGMRRLAERLAYMNLPLPLGKSYSTAIRLGPRGDAVINQRTAAMPNSLQRIAETAPHSLAFDPDSNNVKAIETFVHWAAADGVRVLATWPNVLDLPAYRGPAAQDFYMQVRAFYDALGVQIVGTPEAALFSPDDVFDERYHLHRDAVARRTAILIPKLRRALATRP